MMLCIRCLFFFQAEDGIRDPLVTGVQTCALPILSRCAQIKGIGPRAHLDTAPIQATRVTERTTLSRACQATKTATAHETESCAPALDYEIVTKASWLCHQRLAKCTANVFRERIKIE